MQNEPNFRGFQAKNDDLEKKRTQNLPAEDESEGGRTQSKPIIGFVFGWGLGPGCIWRLALDL